jgi:hypothetical protein
MPQVVAMAEKEYSSPKVRLYAKARFLGYQVS